jgi:hypothetical protein
MKRYPKLWKLQHLFDHIIEGPKRNMGSGWVPARPEGFASLGNRLRCAWLVFTGKADAVTWPEDDLSWEESE